LQLRHQISVVRSHIREVFDRKFENIFEGIKFEGQGQTKRAKQARQNAVQHLRERRRYIYIKDSSGKFVRPFTSLYIQRSLYFLFFRRHPRFGNIFGRDQHINHHTLAVVCTFVSVSFARTTNIENFVLELMNISPQIA